MNSFENNFKNNMDSKNEVLEALKANLPVGFEVSEKSDGKIEIILSNQDHSNNWKDILVLIKEKVIDTMKLYDFDGKDDVYIEIKNPSINKTEDSGDAMSIRFREEDMGEKDFNDLQNNKHVSLSHIMTLGKNKNLTLHEGMIRSVTVK